MSTFSLDERVRLMASVPPPAVSIYLPRHRAVPETRQDPIRFKNLLRAVEGQVLAAGAGARAAEASAMLAPAFELLEDTDFCLHQQEGLAVFAAVGFFRRYRVPSRLDEMVVVSHRFHVKPLVPLVTGDSTFFLLALSQNQVRLFEGTRDTISEIDLEGVPPSLAEALKYDDPQNSSGTTRASTRTISSGSSGRWTRASGSSCEDSAHRWYWPAWSISSPSTARQAATPASWMRGSRATRSRSAPQRCTGRRGACSSLASLAQRRRRPPATASWPALEGPRWTWR